MIVHGIPGDYELERGDVLSIDVGVVLHNDTIVAALVEFYGCVRAPAPENAYDLDWRTDDVVDMYWHRESLCGDAQAIMDDPGLIRPGMREFIDPLGRD